MYHASSTFIDQFWPKMYLGEWTYQKCTKNRGTCTYHRVIYWLTLHAQTNIPLSSARLLTSFHCPLVAQVLKLVANVSCYNSNKVSSYSRKFCYLTFVPYFKKVVVVNFRSWPWKGQCFAVVQSNFTAWKRCFPKSSSSLCQTQSYKCYCSLWCSR